MSGHKTRLITQDDTLFVHTVFDDDEALKRNKQIKEAELLNKPKLGIHDNHDLRFILSIPDVFQWNLWKKHNQGEYRMLVGRDETLRIRAAKKLALSHPEWVIFERH